MKPLNETETVLSFKKVFPDYKEGAYAVVFFSSDNKATKVFRRRNDVPKDHVESVFNSEVRAYEIARRIPQLRDLTPDFFGMLSVQSITDRTGNDISSQFFLDLAYQMERVNGEFVKIGSFPREETNAVSQLFVSAGIRHIRDASIVVAKCGKISKIIDFAIEEYVLEHQTF